MLVICNSYYLVITFILYLNQDASDEKNPLSRSPTLQDAPLLVDSVRVGSAISGGFGAGTC